MAQHKFYVSDKSEIDFKELPDDTGKAINDKLRELFYDEMSKTKKTKE